MFAAILVFVAINKGDVDIEFTAWRFKFAFREKGLLNRDFTVTYEPKLVTK